MKLLLIIALIWVAQGRELQRVESGLIFSANRITGGSSDNWKISPTAGIYSYFPLKQSLLRVGLEVRGGEVSSKDGEHNFTTLLISIPLKYPIEVHEMGLYLEPIAGITNLTYFGGGDLYINKPFAGDTENEFGLMGGGALTYRRRVTLASLQFTAKRIFSMPQRVTIISGGLSLGVEL